ncbi:MAG: hypothetical protein PVI97_05620 [Candidatus Thiodiazotropha sp.]
MRWLSVVMGFCALLILALPCYVFAEQTNRLLSHNPFSKPSILATPKNVVTTEQTVQEESPLVITAILVSDDMPLVIAAGELLTLGETVSGYRLISVVEGKATFKKNGNTYAFSLLDSGVEIEE